MSAITTAVSGLNAAVTALDVSAQNVANAHSNGPLSDSSWGPATVVGSSSQTLQPQAYQPLTTVDTTGPGGVVDVSTAPVNPPTQPAYDPTSPFADARGLVAEPNVDPSTEIVGQMSSLQSFRSNLATLRVADEMQKTLLAIV
jgi:flagellar basal-body rod protein FlgC